MEKMEVLLGEKENTKFVNNAHKDENNYAILQF